ncbi:hypothetical protein I305_02854 [Cryptococcus gattii E566]|uniref:N-acetyltransferase domain-containing protein n=1 Tax=Cryptococcus gattii EJB2 TaxID=1296103 RepID=A0ABR5BS74_9TREE|nr:hypothetical protein I306_04410 [Cryptococcus gattii EJB2]KIY34664.1 hypothetical protein I305_02854 [Cryptococcus gattii E566]
MSQSQPPSSDDVDIVRTFDSSKDERMVKMIVGQGVMEGLARANNKIFTNPLALLFIFLVGMGINHISSFSVTSNPLSYISPLIGPCLALLPLMGIVEYIHRPQFTARMRKIIGAVDMIKPSAYYAEGKSGIWVFQHKGEVVGVVCLDATKDAGKELGSVLGEEEGQLNEKDIDNNLISRKEDEKAKNAPDMRRRITRKENEPSSRIAEIRHLDVDQPYRRSGVGSELVLVALDRAFSISSDDLSSPVDRVIVRTNPLSPDSGKLFIKCGFKPITQIEASAAAWEKNEKIGLLGWAGECLSVDKDTWVIKRKELLEQARVK